jgi:hypothetical protein
MVWWEALLWGLFGGLAVVALDFCQWARKPRSERRKLKLTRGDYALVITGGLVRTALGGGLAAAMAHDGQVLGAMGGVGIGAAAPLILVHLAQAVAPPQVAADPVNAVAPAGTQQQLSPPPFGVEGGIQ